MLTGICITPLLPPWQGLAPLPAINQLWWMCSWFEEHGTCVMWTELTVILRWVVSSQLCSCWACPPSERILSYTIKYRGVQRAAGQFTASWKVWCWKDFGVQIDSHICISCLPWLYELRNKALERALRSQRASHCWGMGRCSEPGLLPALLHPRGCWAVTFLSRDTCPERSQGLQPQRYSRCHKPL